MESKYFEFSPLLIFCIPNSSSSFSPALLSMPAFRSARFEEVAISAGWDCPEVLEEGASGLAPALSTAC